MSFAQNALVVGLIGLAYYHFRLFSLLREKHPSLFWWDFPGVLQIFRQELATLTDPVERRRHQKILNGFYFCLLYILVALGFLIFH